MNAVNFGTFDLSSHWLVGLDIKEAAHLRVKAEGQERQRDVISADRSVCTNFVLLFSKINSASVPKVFLANTQQSALNRLSASH